jgi:acetyl esterase
MVAAVADYRVHCRHHSTPFESVADGAAAIRWIRAHATELGVDPGRIAAGGGSAGGHVALSCATFEGLGESIASDGRGARPDALILFNPGIDLIESRTRKFIVDTFGSAVADRVTEISPFQHVPKGLPPTLILNGTADKGTPYMTAEKYCNHSRSLGNDCRLVGFEGAPHGLTNAKVDGGKWIRPTLLEADRFLSSIGYIPAQTR